MHAIHPHIQRPMLVTVAAVFLTILVMLVFAARVGDISLGSSSSAVASPAPGASTHAPGPVMTRQPAWLGNPLGPPFTQRITLPWKSQPTHSR